MRHAARVSKLPRLAGGFEPPTMASLCGVRYTARAASRLVVLL
jgi:hypothetical protein